MIESWLRPPVTTPLEQFASSEAHNFEIALIALEMSKMARVRARAPITGWSPKAALRSPRSGHDAALRRRLGGSVRPQFQVTLPVPPI